MWKLQFTCRTFFIIFSTAWKPSVYTLNSNEACSMTQMKVVIALSLFNLYIKAWRRLAICPTMAIKDEHFNCYFNSWLDSQKPFISDTNTLMTAACLPSEDHPLKYQTLENSVKKKLHLENMTVEFRHPYIPLSWPSALLCPCSLLNTLSQTGLHLNTKIKRLVTKCCT